MPKPDPKTMPRDTDGELHRASLTLNRIRALLTSQGDKKTNLPPEWRKWVAEQVAGDYADEGAA